MGALHTQEEEFTSERRAAGGMGTGSGMSEKGQPESTGSDVHLWCRAV